MERLEQCKTVCPKYLLCEAMVEAGIREAAKPDNPYFSTDIEYETDDGSLVSGDEFFGVVTHKEAGEAMQQAGRNLGEVVLENCSAGPLNLGGENYLCRSSASSAVEFTYEDLK